MSVEELKEEVDNAIQKVRNQSIIDTNKQQKPIHFYNFIFYLNA